MTGGSNGGSVGGGGGSGGSGGLFTGVGVSPHHVLEGHNGPVSCLGFTDDGSRLVSGERRLLAPGPSVQSLLFEFDCFPAIFIIPANLIIPMQLGCEAASGFARLLNPIIASFRLLRQGLINRRGFLHQTVVSLYSLLAGVNGEQPRVLCTLSDSVSHQTSLGRQDRRTAVLACGTLQPGRWCGCLRGLHAAQSLLFWCWHGRAFSPPVIELQGNPGDSCLE